MVDQEDRKRSIPTIPAQKSACRFLLGGRQQVETGRFASGSTTLASGHLLYIPLGWAAWQYLTQSTSLAI